MSEGTDVELYRANHPAAFWRLQGEPSPTAVDWRDAVRLAVPVLPPAAQPPDGDLERALYNTLGEGQFGSSHWQLDALKRAYYLAKPMLPKRFCRNLRRLSRGSSERSFGLGWPIEDRYARFQWEVARAVLERMGRRAASHIHFWPYGHAYAFAITHDVETAEGQSFVRAVADLDAMYGFRSSFNFVPEGYPLDWKLIDDLQRRGFEVGVHGLTHDGNGFGSYREFMRRAERINRYVTELGAVGFRAPLTHRHPGWMQALDIEYDCTFFDTDPYEPIAGGTMSIWPFMIGRFVELPYTLVQDHTLIEVLKERTPAIWLGKLPFLRRYHGLALVGTHPDYLRDSTTWQVYADFLRAMRERGDFWHALPKEVARWWRARATAGSLTELAGGVIRTIGAPAMPELAATAPAAQAG